MTASPTVDLPDSATSDESPAAASPGWLRRLWGYCLRHPWTLGTAFGAAVLGALISTVVPLIVRRVVDELVDAADGNRAAHIGPWIALLVSLAVVTYACTFCRRYAAGRLSLDVQYDMRADVFSSLTRMDGPTHDRIDTGQIVSRSITDIGLVQGLLQIIPALTGNAILFVLSLVVMAVLSPTLTIVTVLVAPALFFVASRSRRDLFPANWSAQQQSGVLVGHVEAAVTGVRVVKGFGQEGRELDALDSEAHVLYRLRMRVVRLQAKYSAALQAIPSLGQVGVLSLGGYLALNGHITLGTFLAFSTYLAQLVGPVRMLTSLLTVGQQARAGVERVMEVVDTKPTIVDPPGARDIPLGPGGSVAVEFDDVAFGHDERRKVLDGLSLRIDPGETVAIVGGSGSGKSTLVMLLDRIYDADAGRVLVGGVDVRDARMSSVRSMFGIVFEDTFLFSDTIRSNIAYGRPDASDAEIVAAAQLAQADGFIAALPDGYDSIVGERGLTLSGGQRQRVALARALLADAPVLVLDDATSAIDPRVEARIVAGLRETRRGRSTLIIAHRTSTLELADRIVVLDRGQVAAEGTRAELEESSPLFRRLMSAEPSLNEHAALLAESGIDLSHNGAITEHLWQGSRQISDRGAGALQRQIIETGGRAAAGGGGARGGGRGRGGGGGGGGMLSSVPASADLLRRVSALPEAVGEPDISPQLARAGDSHFGLGRLLRPVRRILAFGLALVALDTVAQLIVPALVRSGIDNGVMAGSAGTLFVIGAIAFAVILFDWVISRAALLVTGRTGERLLYLLRVKTFAHLQRLGLDYYERELGGRIMTRMTTDIDALSNFLQTGLTTTLVSLLTLIGVLIALIILDAGLALVLVAMLPILLVATLIFRAKAVPAYVEARERVSAVNAQLQEEMFGLRTTQAFGREEANTVTYLAASKKYRDSRLRAQRYISTYFPFIQFLSDLAGAAVLLFGATRLRDGTLSAGSLIAFFLYLEAFFSPVQQLSQVFDGYQQASVGLSRLRDLLRTPTTTPAAENPKPVGDLTGAISLRDVHFRYQGASKDALDGVDIDIAAGETVAFVGETGAGKSSLVKLLARFYDVTGGSVQVDGRDVRDLDLAQYRARLGLVPQEPYLSPGTIRDAIAYGRPSATDSEVEAASRAVGAHPMIASLPGGYLHDVGERGSNLSAGQRQLVALARAQLVQPDILLLDEATAALDLASEAIVTAATERLARKCTTIVVAHRLTTAARADRIIVLDNGRVVQTGSHAELLRHEGAYAALWAAYSDRPVDVSDSVAG